MPLVPHAVTGFWDYAEQVIESERDFLEFRGWAANDKNSKPAEAILVFLDGQFVFSGRTNFDRPNVAEANNDPSLLRTGYYFAFPLYLFSDGVTPGVFKAARVFPVQHRLGIDMVAGR